MAITMPPQAVNETAAAEFLQGAPDAAAVSTGGARYARVRQGRKVQVSFALPEQLLDALEKHAAALGQSRAFVLNLAVMEYLKGLHPGGETARAGS